MYQRGWWPTWKKQRFSGDSRSSAAVTCHLSFLSFFIREGGAWAGGGDGKLEICKLFGGCWGVFFSLVLQTEVIIQETLSFCLFIEGMFAPFERRCFQASKTSFSESICKVCRTYRTWHSSGFWNYERRNCERRRKRHKQVLGTVWRHGALENM